MKSEYLNTASTPVVSVLKMPYLIIKSHHVAGGINFDANNQAQRELSGNAFRMYAHLLKKGWYQGEILLTNQIKIDTRLTAAQQRAAMNELISAGYLTEGPVIMKKATYSENSFHLWESPSLCKSA